MDPSQIYASMTASLRSHADVEFSQRNEQWFKEPGFRSYGLRASAQGEVMREHKKAVQALDLPARLALARRLASKGIAEELNLANWILALSTSMLQPSDYDFLDDFLDFCNNWGASDDFCINVFQPLLLKYPRETLDLAAQWNRSPNRWKRRASVVLFTRKVGASGRFTDEMLACCEHLIWDAEDLVQKGVGWALKDGMRGAKNRVLEYVLGLRRRGVCSVITLYAMRDLKGEERQAALAAGRTRDGRAS